MVNNFTRFICVAILFFSVISSIGVAQNRAFKNINTQDGLPSATIYEIIQDKRGYIWLGTDNGLAIYDGSKFETYTKKNGIAGNIIRSVFEDKSGKIWIGTNEGISVYDGYRFTNLTKKDGIFGKTVLCIFQDSKGRIWAGTDDGGINIISLNQKNNYVIHHVVSNQQNGDMPIFDMFEHANHEVWAITLGAGINIINEEDNQFSSNPIKSDLLPSENLLCYAKKNNHLIIGTADAGAFELDIHTKKIRRRYNNQNILSSNYIYAIEITQSGSIWFGSADQGITRLWPNNTTSIYKTNQGLTGNIVTCMLEDTEQNLWIGTSANGLSILSNDCFDHFNKDDGLNENVIQAIKQDANGNFWIASSGGGLQKLIQNKQELKIQSYTTKNGFPEDLTTCIALGNKNNNNVWIGTNSNGLIKFDGKWSTKFTENEGLISNKIYSVYIDSKGLVWCGTAGGIVFFDGLKFQNLSTEELKMRDGGVKTIIEDKNANIWFGTSGGLVRYHDSIVRTFNEVEGLKDINVNAIAADDLNNIWIATNGGSLYKYKASKADANSISFIANFNYLGVNSLKSIAFANKNQLFLGCDKGLLKVIIDKNDHLTTQKLFDKRNGFIGEQCTEGAICIDNNNVLWIGTYSGLTKYTAALELEKKSKPKVHITSIQLFYKEVNWLQKTKKISQWFHLPLNLKLPYNENHLTFNFKGIAFENPSEIKYSYLLQGQDKVWSPYNKTSNINFSALAPGNYIFKVIAHDMNGNNSAPALFSFEILPPWYQTKLFYITAIIVLIAIIYFYIKLREHKLKQEKKILEKIVVERTQEIVHQKEEIDEQNKEIIASITYAKGLQDAILPPMQRFKNALPESFIIFKPKDIVSGDFYWMEIVQLADERMPKIRQQLVDENKFKNNQLINSSADQLILFAACDCTGHGVPGAMVSMVCNNALNRAVKEFGLIDPGLILDKVREFVIITFANSENERKDGMDISLCLFDKNKMELKWAGANNPLWIIRKDAKALDEIKANKQPIGNSEFYKPFATHTIKLNIGDSIYIFTDGFQDQFGGEKGKKYMVPKLRELFLSVVHKPMDEQFSLIEAEFENWKKGREQVDDVCVIGIRF
jgi:ligand-binding sensor domain-containing protein/serine phosphatase RsbU (regulator of sigma subunit)